MMGPKKRPLTIQNVRIVNSYRTHFLNIISVLSAKLLFSRIVELNSWIVAVALAHYGLQTSANYSVFHLPLTGVVGIHQRLRLVTPTQQSFKSKNRPVMHPCVIAILTTPRAMEKHHG
jgi:hypothetical protein